MSEILSIITPVIITYNEAANIERTLSKLRWATRVIVVDSGSTDGTLDIIAAFNNVSLHTRVFDSFAAQCNFALSLVDSEWVLSLDADYVLTDNFVDELILVLTDPKHDGYFVPLMYCIDGRPLRNSLLPPRCCLFRKSSGCYRDDGHAHRLTLTGSSGSFKAAIMHDDRKSFQRWFSNQITYARHEVAKLRRTPLLELSTADRIRSCIIIAPVVIAPVCLIGKGCLLDGLRGLKYTLQRIIAESLLSLYLLRSFFTGR